MIRRKASAASVDFCLPNSLANPFDDMFENPLIKLMENIGCDRLVYVEKRQVLPKRSLDRFDVNVFARFSKLGRPSSYLVECIEDGAYGPWRLYTVQVTKALG